MAVFDDHKNFAVTVVAIPPSPATTGTVLGIPAGHVARFPAVPFNVTLWPADAAADPTNAEIARVTGISTDFLTLTRAQEGSTARAVIAGDQIAATITDKTLTDIETAIPVLPAADTLVTVLDRKTAQVNVSNTATETAVYTYTVPGGTIGTNGLLELVLQGEVVVTTGASQLHVRVKYGGVELAWFSHTWTVVSTPHALSLTTRLAGGNATGTQRANTVFLAGAAPGVGTPTGVAEASFVATTGIVSVNSATAQILTVTYQWTTANPAAMATMLAAHLRRV